jgi:glucosyl-dolichyl phosphate glucuronosyltransferase
MQDPQISVIICTYRRFEYTQQVVSSLCQQTLAREKFEIIVVDNDTTYNSELREIVKTARSKVNISYLFENQIGLSNARNAGGHAARAKNVVYIDDDALAPPKYLEKLLLAINNHHADIIGGPIYAAFNCGKPKWYKDSYGSSTQNGQSFFLKSNQYISGTSICFKKSLLEDVGWFDRKLGMIGRKIWLGEETMVQIMAWRNNPELKVWFDQSISIRHFMQADKLKLRSKFHRSFNSGKAQAYLWLQEHQKSRVKNRALYTLFKTILFFIIKGIPGIFFRSRKKYPYWQNYAYEILARYFASFGQELQYLKDFFKKT